MPNMQWIIDQMESLAPAAWAESWDNVGLLIGDHTQPVKKVLVALDATESVIREAIEGNYNCIVTHHALLYNPVKKITTADPTGRKIIALITHGIALFTAHTNIDKAPGGVNDCLAEKLGIINTAPLSKSDFSAQVGGGRFGELSTEMTLAELATHVKNVLNLNELRYSGDLSSKIKKVGICGGSGMSLLQDVINANCDVFITGDVKFADSHALLDAEISLLDVTHYGGEVIIVDTIVQKLREKAAAANLPLEINATSIDGQTFHML